MTVSPAEAGRGGGVTGEAGAGEAGTTRRVAEAALARLLGSAAEARWMADAVLGAGTSAVRSQGAAALRSMAERRLAGEPLQYVLGAWAFRTLDLAVDSRALIPRPETEQVAGAAMDEVRRVATGRACGECARVADLGTGSGAIALALASELGPGVTVWATDADPGALALASVNLGRVGATCPQVVGRVELVAGDWYQALPAALRGTLDVVVSNPPYVSEAEWPDLDPVVRHEPRRALVAGTGSDGTPGLAAVEAVLAGAPAWLAPEGAVVVEMAPHQVAAAARLASRAGLGRVRVVTDLAGRDRALVARR